MTTYVIKKQFILQFIKFCFVGALNTSIHYCVFILIYKGLSLDYMIASGIGYCVATINSFIVNKKWVFNFQSQCRNRLYIKFASVNLLSMLVNLFSINIMVELLTIDPLISQLLAIIASVGVNFLGSKLWVFRRRKLKEN